MGCVWITPSARASLLQQRDDRRVATVAGHVQRRAPMPPDRRIEGDARSREEDADGLGKALRRCNVERGRTRWAVCVDVGAEAQERRCRRRDCTHESIFAHN